MRTGYCSPNIFPRIFPDLCFRQRRPLTRLLRRHCTAAALSTFRNICRPCRLPAGMLAAATMAMAFAAMRAKLVIPAADAQPPAAHQYSCQLLPCAIINRLCRGTRHAHLRRALLLRHPFQIDQADRFKLIHRHNDRFPDFLIQRPKPQTERPGADPPSFTWSWHLARLFSLGIV